MPILSASSSIPPVEPADEQIIAADAAFVRACLDAIAILPNRKGWRLGKQLVTRSPEWGQIWRADFEVEGEPLAPLINRLILWRDGDAPPAMIVAIGQDVPPL